MGLQINDFFLILHYGTKLSVVSVFFPLYYLCGRGLVSMTSSRTRRNKKAICDMIMFILTIIYVAFFYYVFYNPDKNNTLSTFTHERPLALYQSLNPMAVFFGSEYQSYKEYMTFLPVLIKLKSRENNN